MAPDHEHDRYAPLRTAAGDGFVAFNSGGVRFLALDCSAAEFEAHYRARFGRPVAPAPGIPEPVARAIDAGAPVAADLSGETAFARAVLTKIQEIPPGQVRSYAWVAREIGHPRAVRAVGSALARNPVPVLVPCHRVVRSDGRIGQYALGSERKRVLLATETDTAAH